MEQGVIRTPRVADAIRNIPREAFLDATARPHAYEDHPLPIGLGQTISAPHMVAIMCENLDLQPGHRVLEVGTGSGYHAAVTAQLVAPDGRVVTVEFRASLAERARRHLNQLGFTHVTVVEGDGASGGPEHAPYDRIYLTAATPRVPEPLLDQLAPDGLLLAPVGASPSRLLRMRRDDEGQWVTADLGACAFVPLQGPFGRA